MQVSQTSFSLPQIFPLQKKKPTLQKEDVHGFSHQIYHQLHEGISNFKTSRFSTVFPTSVLDKINAAASIVAPYKTSTKLPRDNAVIIKKLDNGLTYYVRNHTRNMPQKAYLRLVIRVGMLNETPEEKGIAHLIEHITQIETEKFSKDKIFNYLSSKGVHWSRDNNAYTSADETVYKLDIPLDDPEMLEQSLLILSQVASKATLSEEVINNEREIVCDELSQGKGPWTTYSNMKRRLTCEGTPYATIVDKDKEIKSVRGCPTEVIQAFYKRWYQPENMAVIAVGDFDLKKTSALVEKYFGSIASSQLPPSEHNYHLKTNPGSRFLCFSNPEVVYSVLEIFHQLPKLKYPHEMQSQKMSLVIDMVQDILSERLDLLIEADNSPFVEIDCSNDDIISEYPYFNIGTIVKEGQIPTALKQLLLEIRRIKTHGFTQGELDRIKKTYLASLNHSIQEKDKISSNRLVKHYHSHFRDNTIISDINKMSYIKKQIVEKISLKDLDAAASYLLPDENRLISTAAPEKSDLEPITEDILKNVIELSKNEEVLPIIEGNFDIPLIKQLPKPGRISSTKLHKRANVTEYTLQNGMRVFLKPTSFKNNEVLIQAISIDGMRDADVSIMAAAKFSNDFFDACGLGDFDSKTLNKILTGKQVNFSATIGSYITSLKTASVPKDLETAFQLIHLMFTNPGYDLNVFRRTLKNTEEVYRNQHKNPSKIFSKELIETITQKHPEFKPLTFEDFQDVDFETCKNFHQKKFSNPANFSLAIVGNIQQQKVKSLVERYLASLVQVGEKRTVFDYTPVPFPAGIIHKTVYAGKESSGTTIITFPAPISDDINERLLSNWCCEILEMRLTKTLRFEAGITYSQSCNFANTSIPGLNPNTTSKAIIAFTGDPIHHPTLEKLLMEQIKDMQTNGPTEAEIADFQKNTLSAYVNSAKTNSNWVENILSNTTWNRDQNDYDNHIKELKLLTPAKAKVQFNKIFKLDNYVSITHSPVVD